MLSTDPPRELSTPLKLLLLMGPVGFAALSLPPDGGSLAYRYSWFWTLATFCLLPLACGLFLWARDPRGKSGWWTAGTAMIIVALGISTLASRFPDRGFIELLVPGGAIGLGLLTSWYVSGAANRREGFFRLQRVLGGVAGLGAILCAESLYLWWAVDFQANQETAAAVNQAFGYVYLAPGFFEERNVHPFGHANFTAGFALLLTPLQVGLAFSARGAGRVCWGLAAGLSGLVVVSSGSRAGLVALAALAGLGALIFFLRLKIHWSRLLLFLGLGGVAMLALPLTHERTLDALSLLLVEGAVSNSDASRLALLQTGWEIGAARPLSGHGLGTTSLVYPEFWVGESRLPNAFQLHNTPLQIWADLGVGGVLAVLLLGLGVVQSAIALGLESRVSGLPGQRRALLAGVFFSLLGYGIFALGDFQLNVYFISGTVAVLLGCLSGEFPRKRPGPHEKRSVRAAGLRFAVAAVCLGGFAAATILTSRPRAVFAEASSSLASEHIDTAIEQFAEASMLAPGEPYYRNILGSVLAEAATSGAPPANAPELIALAKSTWKQSLVLAPVQEFPASGLGWLTLGEAPADAIGYFLDAASRDPQRTGQFFGAALAFRKQKNDEAAYRALALECLFNPEFVTFPLWESDNFKPVVPEVAGYLREYQKQAQDACPPGSTKRRLLEATAALTLWFWYESADLSAIENAPEPGLRAFGRLLAGEGDPYARILQGPREGVPRTMRTGAWYQAWAAPDESRTAAIAEGMAALHFSGHAPELDLAVIKDYLAHGRGSFPDLLRRANQAPGLPLRIYQSPRHAAGILAHNLDGPVPRDLFPYERNLFLVLALEPVIPRYQPIPRDATARMIEDLRGRISPGP